MATILPFKPGRRPTPSHLPVMSGTAAIIIFPGVRYERVGDAGSCGKATGARRSLKLSKKR